jgi:hypothetical protein
LVGFAGEGYSLAFAGAAGDVEFEDVLRFDDFFALALFAPVLLGDDLARSLTVAALDGFLGDEAGADLTENCLGTWIV